MLNRLDPRGRARSTNTEIEPDGITLPADMGSLLRERREAMGVSLAEVEAATRIRQKYLSALESNDWHLLPGEIVGRGFLRNYAAYLELEPEEILERRRAVVEPRVAAALSQTSAGAPLPPERQVDYRPKEVDLKDETDEEPQPRTIRRGPILATILVALLLYILWQSAGPIASLAGRLATSTQDRIADLLQPPPPTATIDVSMAITAATPTADPANALAPTADASGGASGQSATGTGSGGIVAPTPTNTAASLTVSQMMMTQQASTPADSAAEESTPAPESVAPEQPTPEPPTPEPPTATPVIEEPTPTPEPPTPAPVVQAPACPDPRSVLISPGNGQVVSGVVDVTGTATHEAFQYYKLEYAPGANASDGFVYFDGSNSQVSGGRLGGLNTPSLPNGEYTIQLIVVDQTGNFPPPCQATITIQN